MKYTYTKKQIVESIKYWQKILKQMNESKSQLLDICIKQFDEDIIFSNEQLFELTEQNIKILFKILDNWLFASKLSSIKDLKLFIGNPVQLNSIILDYSNYIPIDLTKYVALYQPDRYDYTIDGKRISTIRKDAIFINIDFHDYTTFSYIFQALCHEMIHAYDMHFGKLFHYMMWALNTGAPPEIIDYNSHFTKVFKQKRNDFLNETNIEIMINANNKDFDELCKKAAENISLLKENDIDNIPTITQEMIDKYEKSELVQFGKDKKTISFSFGIKI